MQINEVEMRFKTPLIDELEKYRGDGLWIHFSTTEKMGVNPHARHGDPAGVYFYYLDWLLENDRFLDGNQYATGYPYWTIVRLIKNDAGIDLQTTSSDRYDVILGRNTLSTYKPDLSGRDFWERLPKSNRPLKGIPYVVDSGGGIIHSLEPYQLLVRDPRVIQIVKRGRSYTPKNTTDSRNYTLGERNREEIVLHNFFKAVMSRYGGKITWRYKKPSLDFDISGATFHFELSGSFNPYLTLTARWGEATHTVSKKFDKVIRELSMDDALGLFIPKIEQIVMLNKRKKYLLFSPFKSINEVIRDMKAVVKKPYEITTTIENDSNMARVEFEHTHREGGNILSSRLLALVYPDRVEYRAYVKVNAYHFADADAQNLDELHPRVLDSFTNRCHEFEPSNKTMYMRKFYHLDDWNAFRGWVATNSCIELVDDSTKRQINHVYVTSDREMLMRDIGRVL